MLVPNVRRLQIPPSEPATEVSRNPDPLAQRVKLISLFDHPVRKRANESG
jgi:hypothetical protein